MIIYVDIDETICEYGDVREYPLAKPIKKRIEKMNSLLDGSWKYYGHRLV